MGEQHAYAYTAEDSDVPSYPKRPRSRRVTAATSPGHVPDHGAAAHGRHVPLHSESNHNVA